VEEGKKRGRWKAKLIVAAVPVIRWHEIIGVRHEWCVSTDQKGCRKERTGAEEMRARADASQARVLCRPSLHLLSVVLSSRDDLQTGGPCVQCVLELGGVAALGIDQRWVRPHDVGLAQLLQTQQVPRQPRVVQPPPTEGQRPMRRVDVAEEVLGRFGPQPGRVARRVLVVDLHVVAALHVLQHEATTGGAERLDGVELVLLHLTTQQRHSATQHTRHRAGQRGEEAQLPRDAVVRCRRPSSCPGS
jgi:hypothetical protein